MAIVRRITIVVAAVGVGMGLMWAAPLPRPPRELELAPAALPLYQTSKPAHTKRLTSTHPARRKPCGFDAPRAYLSCRGYGRVFGGEGGPGR